MSLQNIFQMVKADKYTADGREELIKAWNEEVEDRVYKIGEISEKTGLQKTANGWVKPKQGGNGALKEVDAKAYNKAVKNISSERLQEAFNKREGKQLTPEAKAKHEIIKAELAKRSGGSAKFDEYGLPSKETIAMKDKFLKENNVADPSKLSNAEFNSLAEKLDKKLGIGNKERAQELLVAEAEKSDAESNPAETKNVPSQEDLLAKKRKWDTEGGPSNETERAEYDKLRSQIKYKLPDEKSSFGTDVSRMKKLKQQDPREFSIQLEKLHSKYPGDKWQNLYNKATSDSAPRVLTGDCKIRVRK